MADESSRCGDDDVGTQLQPFPFLLKSDAVVSSIDSYARHIFNIIAESLYLLVYLLSKFAGWRHDDTVDRIFRVKAGIQFVKYRQKISRGFSCTGLCDADDIPSFQNGWNGLFLYRCALLKVHCVQSIQHFV